MLSCDNTYFCAFNFAHIAMERDCLQPLPLSFGTRCVTSLYVFRPRLQKSLILRVTQQRRDFSA